MLLLVFSNYLPLLANQMETTYLQIMTIYLPDVTSRVGFPNIIKTNKNSLIHFLGSSQIQTNMSIHFFIPTTAYTKLTSRYKCSSNSCHLEHSKKEQALETVYS